MRVRGVIFSCVPESETDIRIQINDGNFLGKTFFHKKACFKSN